MHFDIKIRSNDTSGNIDWVVNIYEKSYGVGFEKVDWIRKQVGVEKLDIKVMPDNIPSKFEKTWNIKLPEELASESNLFQETNRVVVHVPRGYLNQFMELTCTADKNQETGEICQVKLGWGFDKSAFIDHWKELGFPIEIAEPQSEDE